jgi:hypothetical protein
LAKYQNVVIFSMFYTISKWSKRDHFTLGGVCSHLKSVLFWAKNYCTLNENREKTKDRKHVLVRSKNQKLSEVFKNKTFFDIVSVSRPYVSKLWFKKTKLTKNASNIPMFDSKFDNFLKSFFSQNYF